jgi:hypothetical protein
LSQAHVEQDVSLCPASACLLSDVQGLPIAVQRLIGVFPVMEDVAQSAQSGPLTEDIVIVARKANGLLDVFVGQFHVPLCEQTTARLKVGAAQLSRSIVPTCSYGALIANQVCCIDRE